MKNEKSKIEDAVIVTENGNDEKALNTAKNEIQKFNLADASIEALKKKYKGLKVKGPEDEKGISLVMSAHNVVKKVRTDLENKRKDIKAPYLAIGNAIDAEAKRLTKLILEVENPLKSEAEKVKLWEQEAAEKLAKEKADRLAARMKTLKDAGLVFDGVLYSINDISMDVVAIEKMSDADYEFLLAKVKIEKQKNIDAAEAAAKAEAEARKEAEAEAEKQRKIAAENARKQKELNDEILELRGEALLNLGFEKDDKREMFMYLADGVVLHSSFSDLIDMNSKDFKTYVKYKDQQITDGKASAEAKRLQDAEAKEAADKKAEAEKLERLPDLERINAYTDELLKIKAPELKNKAAQDVLLKFTNSLRGAVNNALAEVKNLK